MTTKRVKGSVWEGESGKKAKVTQYTGGKSVSEDTQVDVLHQDVYQDKVILESVMSSVYVFIQLW